jgi:putative cardiolipin synthase
MHRLDRFSPRLFLVLALAALLSACTTLRSDVPREASYALAPEPDTVLGRFSARVRAPDQASSFRLLESGRAALAARLDLARRATRSLDLQYYLFHADHSGRLLVEALLGAADRGVRVRVLVDDVDTHENEPAIVALDAHPNVQVRLYNPFSVRGLSPLARGLEFLGDKRRLNRRMHNKLFLADNHFGITGGRNIGDEYFQVANDVAFRDLDVMVAGAVAGQMSAAFDAFWNAEPSVPARALPHARPDREELEARRDRLAAHRAELEARMAPRLDLDTLTGPAEPGLGPWTPGRAELISDAPDKTAGTAHQDDLALTRLLAMGQTAREEVLIASSYFVPRPLGTAHLVALRQRGVRVRILTNSLAATDVPLVHAGYARYRPDLLAAGVELFELKPIRESPVLPVTGYLGSSRASLHTKAMVVDRDQTYIGSMNLDPRSAWLNTEGGLLIHGPDMAAQVTRYIEASLAPEQSYQVRIDPDSPPDAPRLVWLDRRDGEVLNHGREPGAGFLRRWLIQLIGGFIEEDL